MFSAFFKKRTAPTPTHLGRSANKRGNANEFTEFLPDFRCVMSKPPTIYSRVVSILIMLFVSIALLWLYFAEVDIVVSAAGKIVPTGKTKVVQAAEEGVVRHIFVRDGMTVKRGDRLIAFDSTVSQAELSQIKKRLDTARLTRQRLKVQLGEVVDFGVGVSDQGLVASHQKMLLTSKHKSLETFKLLRLDEDKARANWQVALQETQKLKGQIRYNRTQASRKQKHAKEGLIAGSEAHAAVFALKDSQQQLAVLQEKVNESQKAYAASALKASAAEVEQRNSLLQALSDNEAELEQATRGFVAATQAMTHQTLRAPVDGVVQQLNVHTVGAVVSRADKLLVLIPGNAKLQVDAQILNKDIGFVDRAQASRIKVDAFKYTRYGYLDGVIDWVGSDAVIDEQKGPVYPARLTLSSAQLPRRVNQRTAKVQPGMSVTVDVVIGTRRLLDYFSGPLLRYRDESLNER